MRKHDHVRVSMRSIQALEGAVAIYSVSVFRTE